MGFAAPFGLAALVSLLLPLVIHLRRRRSPRTVRVGSIRHLAGAYPPPHTGLRVTERRLLAVRLLVLALLALMLAKPFSTALSDPTPPRTVALVSRLLAGPRSARAAVILLDSLRAAGAEIRIIEPEADLWETLRRADAELPGDSRVALVTTERARISGARPRIRSAVSVHVVPHPADSVVQPPQQPARRRVTILAESGRAQAARYLSAAFRAVAEASGDTLELRRASRADSAASPLPGDWMVWLGDSAGATPDALAERGFRVLTDGGASGSHSGAWTGLSDPSFQVRRTGDGVVFTLDGRFDASSGDLVLSGALPALLASIWPEPERAGDGRAWVSAAQLRPAPEPRGRNRRATPLAMPLLGLATLFFLLERWLSHRSTPISSS